MVQAEAFITIAEKNVYPDGLSIDCEENIWVALWGAGRVAGYRKDGSPFEFIDLPAKNVTSCCFGGKDYKTLFVTSASIDFNGDNKLGKQAGGVFAIDTAVQGLPPYYFLEPIRDRNAQNTSAVSQS